LLYRAKISSVVKTEMKGKGKKKKKKEGEGGAVSSVLMKLHRKQGEERGKKKKSSIVRAGEKKKGKKRALPKHCGREGSPSSRRARYAHEGKTMRKKGGEEKKREKKAVVRVDHLLHLFLLFLTRM